MYEFTKDCMIGIKEIDDEHKKIVRYDKRCNGSH